MADLWCQEAVGIPVWEGASVYDGDEDYTFVVQDMERGAPVADGCAFNPADIVPALDNPDTRAAFLRRLAVRLGCPEEDADWGVRFFYGDNEDRWALLVRQDSRFWGKTFDMGMAPKDDPLLALVRAWRSVKE